MSDDKNQLEEAVDQAVQAFVYAPIGLIFDGPAVYPDLVQRGKNQVQMARMMGELVVQTSQKELSKRLGPAVDQAPAPVRDALSALGLIDGAPSAPTSSETVSEPAPNSAKKGTTRRAAKPTSKRSAPKNAASGRSTTAKAAKSATKAARRATAAASAALGIPEYDSLSASQVVQRLRGLVPEELDAVRAYESSNRARKTILNRIAQLQKD